MDYIFKFFVLVFVVAVVFTHPILSVLLIVGAWVLAKVFKSLRVNLKAIMSGKP